MAEMPHANWGWCKPRCQWITLLILEVSRRGLCWVKRCLAEMPHANWGGCKPGCQWIAILILEVSRRGCAELRSAWQRCHTPVIKMTALESMNHWRPRFFTFQNERNNMPGVIKNVIHASVKYKAKWFRPNAKKALTRLWNGIKLLLNVS